MKNNYLELMLKVCKNKDCRFYGKKELICDDCLYGKGSNNLYAPFPTERTQFIIEAHCNQEGFNEMIRILTKELTIRNIVFTMSYKKPEKENQTYRIV